MNKTHHHGYVIPALHVAVALLLQRAAMQQLVDQPVRPVTAQVLADTKELQLVVSLLNYGPCLAPPKNVEALRFAHPILLQVAHRLYESYRLLAGQGHILLNDLGVLLARIAFLAAVLWVEVLAEMLENKLSTAVGSVVAVPHDCEDAIDLALYFLLF